MATFLVAAMPLSKDDSKFKKAWNIIPHNNPDSCVRYITSEYAEQLGLDEGDVFKAVVKLLDDEQQKHCYKVTVTSRVDDDEYEPDFMFNVEKMSCLP